MKTAFNVIIQVILTFVVSLLINFIFQNYLVVKNGEIQYGPIVELNDKLFYSLQIENYTNKDIDGLRLSIPAYLSETEICSSEPITIENVNTNGQTKKKVISISSIPPLRVVQLLVPIEKATDEQDIAFLNLKGKNIYPKGILIASNPRTLIFEDVLRTSLVYTFIFAIIYGLYSWHQHNKDVEEGAKLADARKELSEVHNKISDIKSKYDKYEANCAKCRVLLLAKLSDYAKENDFWKDSIRKLLYENKTEKTSEQIFEIVTHSLKTYATLCKGKDYDVISCMASMINNNKKTEKE